MDALYSERDHRVLAETHTTKAWRIRKAVERGEMEAPTSNQEPELLHRIGLILNCKATRKPGPCKKMSEYSEHELRSILQGRSQTGTAKRAAIKELKKRGISASVPLDRGNNPFH